MKIASICLPLYFTKHPPVITQRLMKKREWPNPWINTTDTKELGVGWLCRPSAVWMWKRDYELCHSKQFGKIQITASKWLVWYNPSPVSASRNNFLFLSHLLKNIFLLKADNSDMFIEGRCPVFSLTLYFCLHEVSVNTEKQHWTPLLRKQWCQYANLHTISQCLDLICLNV